MSEGLHLGIPQTEFFIKSPANTPTKVLKSLDLLSVDGMFFSKNDPPSGNISTCSSLVNSPMPSRRFQTQSYELRRKSMKADIYCDHTISDEFSHISLKIKERRPSVGSNDSLPIYSFASPFKRKICPKLRTETNENLDEKVFVADEDEEEIEIIDLDDDEVSQVESPPRENCYPNCDVNVWLRSCEQEIIEPVEGVVSGIIPSWINGSLLRNGPGSIKFGDTTYNHLFDASALLHRFNINDGKVTYQCRFLQSDTYKKNLAANRIVVTEFGTSCVPDPCQSIFERFD